MVASVQSPADAANLALARMGYKLRVGSLYDGSMAAKKILDTYAQTRDELLRDGDWDFAEGNVALTLVKQAPVGGYIPPNVWNPATNPPIGYDYEYLYPADCLKIRQVKPTPLFTTNYDPQPHRWSDANDNQLPMPPAVSAQGRVILTNVTNAICVYTRQVTDPSAWDVGFVEAFAATLGRHLGPALVGLQAMQALAADDSSSLAVAQSERG